MTELNMVDLFLKSGILVKFIILVLISFSIVSWAIIIQRTYILNSAIRETKLFEEKFWSGIALSRLYQDSVTDRHRLSGLEKIFYSGFKEFSRLHHSNNYAPESIINAVSSAIRIAMSRELEALETHLPFLSTVGSISPYIGLFGTVCGIMHALIGLGSQPHALQVVAPSIAEALIATAIGLFSAIPALIGFNSLSLRVDKIERNYDHFSEEFMAILYRQVFAISNDYIKRKEEDRAQKKEA